MSESGTVTKKQADQLANATMGVQITPTTPLRLAVAARLAFPDGSMSEKALWEMGHARKLTVEVIRGKHYTTLADIEEMRRLCRVQAKVQGSTCYRPETGGSDTMSSATPSTGSGNKSPALEKARLILRKQKSSSSNTEPQNTTPKPGATVTPIK